MKFAGTFCHQNPTDPTPHSLGLKQKINDLKLFTQLFHRADKIWTPCLYRKFSLLRLNQAFQQHLGVLPTKFPQKPKKILSKILKIPKFFDARLKWAGNSGVKDQGDCAVSWAISAMQILLDRGVVRNHTLLGVTEESLLEKAGTGCAGDSPYFAWKLLGRELDFPANELAIQNEILNNGPVQGKPRNSE